MSAHTETWIQDVMDQAKTGNVPTWDNPKAAHLPNLQPDSIKNMFASIPKVDLADIFKSQGQETSTVK